MLCVLLVGISVIMVFLKLFLVIWVFSVLVCMVFLVIRLICLVVMVKFLCMDLCDVVSSCLVVVKFELVSVVVKFSIC